MPKTTGKSTKKDMLVGVVLDESGSMGSCEPETLTGFNEFIHEQVNQEGAAYLSLTKFDTNFHAVYVATNLAEVADLGTKDNPYFPSGMTALYDGVVVTIKGMEAWLTNNKWYKGQVLCVILTDGGENSSTRNSIDDVNTLIAAKRAEGWDFIFLGSGQAAWTEGQKFTSIPTSAKYAHQGSAQSTADSYAHLRSSVSSSRLSGGKIAASNTMGSMSPVDPSWTPGAAPGAAGTNWTPGSAPKSTSAPKIDYQQPATNTAPPASYEEAERRLSGEVD